MDDTALMFTESFFESAPCGLIVMAGDGTLVRCNLTICDWLGYDQESLHSLCFDQLLTVSGRVFQLTHWGPLMNTQGSVSGVKLDLRHKDGAALSMTLNGIRRVTPEGTSLHLALFSASERDRSDRAKLLAMQHAEKLLSEKIIAEIALHRAQTELSKAYDEAQQRALFAEQMVAVVSHDLKNPMTSIKMASQLLLKDVQGDRALRLLKSIDDSTDRAHRMIVDLLDLASVRLGQGISIRLQQVDLKHLVGESLDELRVVFSAASIRSYSRGNGFVGLDRDRVRQIIDNLVANSVAYGDLNFPITVTTDISRERVVISVHNHGPAIDQELAQTLFEPMVRGTNIQKSLRSIGLGLFIVKNITEAHGGTISMSSTAQSGTTFSVVLPVVTA